ncbi:MAG TPA: MarR family transcriptional regulator [Propionibacteriaceae bacterium]|nr:MarR family transcriptional regulator [Propionibacteriaceae bacterium]
MAHVGRAVEAIVVWARTLDSHRVFPFEGLELTRAQLEALFFIAHTDLPATPGVIAGRLGVTPGAVTQLVAGLMAAGLVDQQRDATDGRRRVLALAPEWAERVAGFEREVLRQLAPRFDGLDDAEIASLAALLQRTTGIPS